MDTIAQRVNDYITKQRNDPVCDGCIAKALGVRHQQANRVTMALETTSDFNRWDGVCHVCGKELKVIERA